MYKIKISDNTKEDLARLKKNDQNLFRKASKLLLELSEHPRTGTGQIERLKYYQEETWSRRISKEQRLVYRINEAFVEVLLLSAYEDYKDK